MAREATSRLRDIVLAAPALNFQLIVGSPVTEPLELYRVRPHIKPDQPLPPLQFYVGAKLWEQFMFIAERYPETLKAVYASDIQFYKKPESPDGTSKGG